MRAPTGKTGFNHPTSCRSLLKQRIVSIELMATAALAVSLVIAMTAVTIGIARADTIGAITDGKNGPFAVALFLGLVLAGMGGLTALVTATRTQPE